MSLRFRYQLFPGSSAFPIRPRPVIPVTLIGPTPPGTVALGNVFRAAKRPVLILFDEVLNFLNRHRRFAESFHAFIQNLTVAMTGTERGAAVISLPRSQVEMTDWDKDWQERITRVVRRVSKDLIVNDEAEIGEVLRRRLFDDIDRESVRKAAKAVAKAYADWCFERRAQLPPEWTAVDTATTEAKAKEFLRGRFEACYPFHPATLSVFQRKWQALNQYQQTRGTLAMLAQWVSWVYREGYLGNVCEPLITLGRAPLDVSDFRSVVLGQLGEPRLIPAIDTDISGAQSHARALDADTKGQLRGIHRRVGATILFESSGGMVDKVAHLPELRFALGEPGLDTTSIDNAASALEKKGFYVRKVGIDGFRYGFQPTLKKVVSDRRASLDDEEDILKPMRALIRKEFEKKASLPLQFFPPDGTAVQDTPKLTVVVLEPESTWDSRAGLRGQILEWTQRRSQSDRLYPGSLVWCVRKPGRDLREKVELWQAWRRVKQEIDEGTLAGEFEPGERSRVTTTVTEAEDIAKDEVWAGYRFVILSDPRDETGLKVIDLGAGHASAGTSLCERIVTALRSQSLLNEGVGAGYLERNWPPALKDSGAWPLSSLRQAFLNGALTRLLDPDTVLRSRIVEFVGKGQFGLASGSRPDGTYDRCWFSEAVSSDEVVFDGQVFLLTAERAKTLKTKPAPGTTELPTQKPIDQPQPRDLVERPETDAEETRRDSTTTESSQRRLLITGTVPPEVWNRLGNKLLPKLRSGAELQLGLNFSIAIDPREATRLKTEIDQVLSDLGLSETVRVDLRP